MARNNGAITWANIREPNFSSSNSLLNSAAENITRSFDKLAGGIQGVEGKAADTNTQNAIAALEAGGSAGDIDTNQRYFDQAKFSQAILDKKERDDAQVLIDRRNQEFAENDLIKSVGYTALMNKEKYATQEEQTQDMAKQLLAKGVSPNKIGTAINNIIQTNQQTTPVDPTAAGRMKADITQVDAEFNAQDSALEQERQNLNASFGVSDQQGKEYLSGASTNPIDALLSTFPDAKRQDLLNSKILPLLNKFENQYKQKSGGRLPTKSDYQEVIAKNGIEFTDGIWLLDFREVYTLGDEVNIKDLGTALGETRGNFNTNVYGQGRNKISTALEKSRNSREEQRKLVADAYAKRAFNPKLNPEPVKRIFTDESSKALKAERDSLKKGLGLGARMESVKGRATAEDAKKFEKYFKQRG